MPQQVEKHLHTYERIKDRPKFWRCIDPHCSHYIQKSLVEGKAAACKYCGKEYIITKYDLKLKIPHCPECTTMGFGVKKPRAAKLVVATNLIGKLFGERDA